jgi:aminoglycoside phosphotransferase (APT) family kinase protein
MTDQSDSHDPLHKIISDHIGEIRSIVPLGEGLDNVAFLVNDELVVRQSNDPNSNSRADAIRREAALLAVVARWSPLPVPEIVFAEPESGLLAYPMLPGQSCIDLPRDATPAVIAEPLGELLTAIHGIPFAEVESLVERDNGPLADWLEEAEEGYAQIAGSIPASSRRQIEAFLAEPPPPEPGNVRFCHNDLGA